MKDRILYDRLELSPDLSHHQLKKEGKKLLLKWHPDKNPDNQKEASKKFIEIKEALDVLTDPEKREKYHQLGTPRRVHPPSRRDEKVECRSDSGGACADADFGQYCTERINPSRRSARSWRTNRIMVRRKSKTYQSYLI